MTLFLPPAPVLPAFLPGDAAAGQRRVCTALPAAQNWKSFDGYQSHIEKEFLTGAVPKQQLLHSRVDVPLTLDRCTNGSQG